MSPPTEEPGSAEAKDVHEDTVERARRVRDANERAMDRIRESSDERQRSARAHIKQSRERLQRRDGEGHRCS